MSIKVIWNNLFYTSNSNKFSKFKAVKTVYKINYKKLKESKVFSC
jgi:hypothetical protein